VRAFKLPRILLVGRNQFLLGVLQNVFAVRGYVVESASEPDELESKLNAAKPDLIVWDYELAHYDLDPTEVGYVGGLIVLTASGPVNSLQNATFISKPFSLEALVRTAAGMTGINPIRHVPSGPSTPKALGSP
jgi:CheY-like chemotaxis protein